MSDSEENKGASAIPSWQRSSETEAPAPDATGSQDDKLEVARRFLDDEGVKDAPREKKIEFLKEKGIEASNIAKLLGEQETPASSEVRATLDDLQSMLTPLKVTETTEELRSISSSPPSSDATNESTDSTQLSPLTTSTQPITSSPTADRPPIVTYPEFLTKPIRPPPLVTKTGLLATLYAFAGLSTLLYGSSKYIVAPMVETQTEARQDFHATTLTKLDSIVAKLEKTVSEVPPRKSTSIEDTPSEAEDPTEMFHRDMGTQTSPLATPGIGDGKEEKGAKKHAGQLAKLSKTLTDLKNEVRAQSEDMEDIKTIVDVFRDELDAMTYAGQNDYLAGYDVYGRSRKAEPDDEIRKVRDNIRRVKGVLLSTRNFPASTR